MEKGEVKENEENKREKKEEPKAVDYGAHSYWDQRYLKSAGSRFEWLVNFESIQAQIGECLQFNKQARILNVGCGNSALSDHLYQEGYRTIVNNDISPVVISQMEKIRVDKGYDEMIYEVMDVRQMSYPQASFDLVIDKSTIDSLLCSDNPILNVAHMLEEIHRVLKPNSYYIAISYSGPSSRMEHLTREHINFQIQTKELTRKNEEGQALVHHLYICRKLPLISRSEGWRKQYYEELKVLEEKEYPSS